MLLSYCELITVTLPLLFLLQFPLGALAYCWLSSERAILVKLRRKEREEIWICDSNLNEEVALSLKILN